MPPFDLYSPTNLRDALEFKESKGEGTVIVASGTDLIPRIRRRQTAPPVLLDISSLQDDLRYIRQTDGVVRLGALATITDLLDSPLFPRLSRPLRSAPAPDRRV